MMTLFNSEFRVTTLLKGPYNKYFLVLNIEKPPKLDILILINTLSSKVKDPIENSLIEGNLWDSLVLFVNK